MGKTIGVIGAGTMGNSIAQTAAAAGYQVILQDVQEKFLQKGLDNIRRNLTGLLKKKNFPARKRSKRSDVYRERLILKNLQKRILSSKRSLKTWRAKSHCSKGLMRCADRIRSLPPIHQG